MLKTVLFRRNHFIHVLNIVSRVRITNTSNSMEMNNHEVKLVFNPSTLGSCGSNGANFGLHTEGGQTLPIWIEKWTSNQAIVWTQVPHIGIGQSKEYIITCDPEHKSENSPDKVFTFYDDFNDPNLSKWEKHYGNGSISVSNSIVTVSHTASPPTYIQTLKNLVADGTNALILEGYLNLTGEATDFGFRGDKGYAFLCYFPTGAIEHCKNVDGVKSYKITDYIKEGQWYLHRITWKSNSFVNFDFRPFFDFTETSYVMKNQNILNVRLGAWGARLPGAISADWVRVRKYIDSEPEVILLS